MVHDRLSDNELNNILRLHEIGWSNRRIAGMYNRSPAVIDSAITRYNQTGQIQYRHGGGRRRSTNINSDRFIRITARRNPLRNASEINILLREATRTLVSTQTVRRRLHEANLRARRRATCVLLLREHRAARRIWAQTHLNWRQREWQNCMFADESRFNLHRSDGRRLVWRQPNERYREEMMEPRVAFGGGGITVWGGIMFNGRTELVIIRGMSVNAIRYRDLCLIPNVVPFAGNYGREFVYVDDNARPHRAAIVNQIFAEHNIERMIWPPRSPDCNPMYGQDYLGS